MGKVIIKKEDEILTLIDEKEIERKIQYTRVCYAYLRDQGGTSRMILNDNSNVSDMTNMDALKDDDVVIIIAYDVSDYSGSLYYADGTTIIQSNFSYTGSASGTASVGIMYKRGNNWECPTVYGQLPTTEVYHSQPLANLGLNSGAKQNTINVRINRQFGYMQTVDVTVTYIDDTTENIKLYQQVMPSS